MTVTSGNSASTSWAMVSRAIRASPLVATITGSSTTCGQRVAVRIAAATDLDDLGVVQHADLDRVDAEIGRNGVDLFRQHLRRHGVDARDTACVLGGDRGDRGHAVHADSEQRS